MIIGHDGLIVAVGPDSELVQKYDLAHTSSSSSPLYVNDLDCTGLVVLPGLVDGHTHPVWAGDRVHEFSMKLAGATYMDIHRAGGGIGYTVQHTREASEEALLSSLLQRLDRALKQGTTLLEAKSGYGLNLEHELKLLRVIHAANQIHPIDLVGNYCGGHSVPKGSTAAEATDDIIQKQIPAIMKAKQDGLYTLEMIDVGEKYILTK